MSSDQDEVERTQAPSPRWVAHSREHGNWPSSRELSAACTVLVALIAIQLFAAPIAHRVQPWLYTTISWRFQFDARPQFAEWERWIMYPLAGTILFLCIPAAVAAVVGIAQSGWKFRPELLVPDWQRLAPGRNLNTLLSKSNATQALLAPIKFSVLVALAVWWIWSDLARPINPTGLATAELAARNAAAPLALATKLSLVLLLFGLADYARAWVAYWAQLKMTRDELRAELRETEGDPTIRRRRRQQRYSRTTSNWDKILKAGDVIVAGHGRIALAIRLADDGATEVVARAAGTVAQSLEREARRKGIVVLDDDRLARKINKRTGVGERLVSDLASELIDRLGSESDNASTSGHAIREHAAAIAAVKSGRVSS